MLYTFYNFVCIILRKYPLHYYKGAVNYMFYDISTILGYCDYRITKFSSGLHELENFCYSVDIINSPAGIKSVIIFTAHVLTIKLRIIMYPL